MSVDWMGRWYEIIKERGENDRPSFGCIDLSTNQIDWMSFSHSEMDGVGAMMDYYEQKKVTLAKFPDLKEKKAPNFLEKIKIFYRLFFKTKNLKTHWKESNNILNPPDPLKISFHIFNTEETERIIKKCHKKKISTTSFILNSVSQSLLSRLSFNEEGTWTVPVNLRPILKCANLKANHSSGILINYRRNQLPEDTHQELSLKLKQKQHWGIWWIHQIGKYLGFQAMRYISNHNAKKSFLIGSFSNLGSWDLPPNHLWVGSPPGSKNFPTSVMLMIANKKMSLSLKIHPSVLKNQELTPVLLNDVVEEILMRVD